MPLPATLSTNVDLIAMLLDSTDNPQSPFSISINSELTITFSWVRVRYGYFCDNESAWVSGEYIITDLKIE